MIGYGRAIRMLGALRGKSQMDMAVEMGMKGSSYLSRVELGNIQPSRRLLESASKSLKIPLSYMIRLTELDESDVVEFLEFNVEKKMEGEK